MNTFAKMYSLNIISSSPISLRCAALQVTASTVTLLHIKRQCIAPHTSALSHINTNGTDQIFYRTESLNVHVSGSNELLL